MKLARIDVFSASLAGGMTGIVAWGTGATSMAMPGMIDDFDLALGQSVWVISILALSLGVGTAMYGRVADSAGPRRYMAFGMALVALGSAFGALAPNFTVLLCCRVLQGLGGAAVVVLSLDSVRLRFDGPARAVALGRWGGASVAVSALGPLIGAAVVEVSHWRVAIALPALAVLPLIMLWNWIPSGGSGAKFDPVGAGLTACVAAALVLVPQLPVVGWWGVAGVAVLLTALIPLSRHVVRKPDGFAPLQVVANGGVWRAAIGAAAVPVVWFGLLSVLPALLTEQGFTLWQVGLALAPGAILGAVLSGWSGRLMVRVGAAGAVRLAGTGAAVSAVIAGVGLSLGSGAAAISLVMIAMLLVYWVSTLGQPGMSARVVEVVSPSVAGAALGFATFVFSLGGSIGAAVAGALTEVPGTWAMTLLAIAPIALTLAGALRLGQKRAPGGQVTARRRPTRSSRNR